MLDWQISIERILRLKIFSKFEIWGSNFTFSCLWQEHTMIESKIVHFLDDLRLIIHGLSSEGIDFLYPY